MVSLDKKTGIIGFISMLLLINIGINVNVDDTHYCKNLNIVKHCDRLSYSGRTCYPMPGTTVGKKLCQEPWLNITKELENNNNEEEEGVIRVGGTRLQKIIFS